MEAIYAGETVSEDLPKPSVKLRFDLTALHLFFFDRLFLRYGRIRRITGNRTETSTKGGR